MAQYDRVDKKILRNSSVYAEIQDRFKYGASVETVTDWLIATDVFATTTMVPLRFLLGALRSSVLKGLLPNKPSKQDYKKKLAMPNRLDVLDELQLLYTLQLERVEMDVTIERGLKKLMKGTQKEIQEARQILKDYAKIQVEMMTESSAKRVKEKALQASALEASKITVDKVGSTQLSHKAAHNVLSLFHKLKTTAAADVIVVPEKGTADD